MKLKTLLFALTCMSASSLFSQSTLNWQELGPKNVGGSTRAILIDHRDSTRNTVYAGMITGGLWKSTDRGTTWHQLQTVYTSPAVCCLAQDANGRIYFGTGDGFSLLEGSSRNSGSVGNGLHFLYGNDQDSSIPSTRPAYLTNTDTWTAINRIAINPRNTNEIFAATSGSQTTSGLQRSTDGGQTWTLIGSAAAPVSGLNGSYIGAADVKYSADGSLVFASLGIEINSPLSSSLILSQDGGNTFSYVHNATFPTGISRIEIGTAPSSPQTAYISIANTGGGFGGVWRTLDGGTTWTKIGANAGLLTSVFGTDGIGTYDNAITVNPHDSSAIYLGGVQLYSYSDLAGWSLASQYIGTPSDPQWLHEDIQTIVFNDQNNNEMYLGTDGGIFKSNDAVTGFPTPNYAESNGGYNTIQNYSIAADLYGDVLGGGEDAGNYLIDINGSAMQIGTGTGTYTEISHFDSSVLIIGTIFGSPYRSIDRGASWLGTLDAVIDPQNQGNPTACVSGSGGNAPFITTFWLAETKNAINSVVKAAFVDNISHSAGEIVSVTSHIGFTFQDTLRAALPAGDTAYFTDRLQSRLYLATECGLWMTPNVLDFTRTPRWFHLTDNANFANTINSLSYTTTGDTIYVGAENKVTRITGLNSIPFDTFSLGRDSISAASYPLFQQTTVQVAGGASTLAIEGIDVDMHNPDHVLCTMAGFTAPGTPHVYASTDAGTTWTAVHNNLPDMPVYQCVIDGYDPDHYIIGSELGFWDSHDAGATWTEQNAGIVVREPVYRLRQQDYLSDQCHILYAGTHGRGMWRCTTLTEAHGCSVTPLGINEPADGRPTDNMWLYPNPMNGQGQVAIQLTQASDVTIQIVDMTGRIIKEVMYSNLQEGKNTLDLNTSILADGSYLVIARVAVGQAFTRTLVVAR